MRLSRQLCAVLGLLAGPMFLQPPYAAGAEPSAHAFVVKPYLQLGNAAPATLQLIWQTDDRKESWTVEYRPGVGQPWKPAAIPTMQRLTVPSLPPYRRYRTTLEGLAAGEKFAYRVLKDKTVVFEAEAHARKGADQPYRFAVFGDCGAGTEEQRRVAYQTALADPDFVMIPGDIVYSRGRVTEYRDRFWPVYNSDQASPRVGAPLLRSTLFVSAPGNHDIASRDFEKYPDGLAYFLDWDQPLNGPLRKDGTLAGPPFTGPRAPQEAFLANAGAAFPRMANFSFDYGNAHWTVLDANPYVNWRDPELVAWIEQDLASAQNTAWRFVAFHHPGFNSAKAHFEEQRTRLLAPLLEKAKVDVVFAGHVHNYQRSFPLRFVPETPQPNGVVNGKWTLDKAFDGANKTKPDGVIYLVSGAGGARLYNPDQQDDPKSWQEFTYKFVSTVHSLTVADVNGSTLKIHQISDTGEELDRFTVTK